MKNRRGLTLTILSNITSNYGESLGNVASIQKVFKNGEIFATRSRESMKNALMVQSGMYEDLKVVVDGATQKAVDQSLNASNCMALEGGYMNTAVGKEKMTFIRNSSFYLTDAIACEPFVNESRFHNNLYLASTFAKSQGINLQNQAKDSGLMPYNYEYDKNFKIYSITFDLEMVGVDENFKNEASQEEKANRVNMILDSIENLHLIVKGNLDNAEPLFIVGGISERKTHVFENVVKVKDGRLIITEDLQDKIKKGYKVGLLEGENFKNEKEVMSKLSPLSITKFFDELKEEVVEYYKNAKKYYEV
ncbi:MAG: type I-B CRISPR-associated protein Cas7/Cst2/DevR [Fusobacteriaceae bacterium]